MNRFYVLPKKTQWFYAILLISIGVLVELAWLAYMALGGWWTIVLLWPIISILQFTSTPIFRLTGTYKYYSPMLLVFNPNEEVYDLHNGTTFDYWYVMKWKDRGIKAKHQILAYYMEGFLKIIEEIEEGILPETVKIVGTSYFFSEATAKRLGFEITKPSSFYVLNIYANYLDLVGLYSYSEGRFALPSIKDIKKVEITGADFVKNKAYYQKLYNFLSRVENETA